MINIINNKKTSCETIGSSFYAIITHATQINRDQVGIPSVAEWFSIRVETMPSHLPVFWKLFFCTKKANKMSWSSTILKCWEVRNKKPELAIVQKIYVDICIYIYILCPFSAVVTSVHFANLTNRSFGPYKPQKRPVPTRQPSHFCISLASCGQLSIQLSSTRCIRVSWRSHFLRLESTHPVVPWCDPKYWSDSDCYNLSTYFGVS